MVLSLFKRAISKHLKMRNYKPYERVLKNIKSNGNIWIASQSEYIEWWRRRESAELKNFVSSNGECSIDTNLENAVFEMDPGKLFSDRKIKIENTDFEGDLLIATDKSLNRKDLLIEILKAEGILNINYGGRGDILLSHELDDLLDRIGGHIKTRADICLEHISKVREIIRKKLSGYNLPLIRLWYHPIIDGNIIKAVFSPRYDVDRAISNVKKIRMLEKNVGNSTFHMRAYGPFYNEKEIREVVAHQFFSDLALHGEFVTNSKKYGDEFTAAKAEKEYLEYITGKRVCGASMHGGELTENVSSNTIDVLEKNLFLYYVDSINSDYSSPLGRL